MYYAFIYCSSHNLRKDQREVEYEKSQISKLKIVDLVSFYSLLFSFSIFITET